MPYPDPVVDEIRENGARFVEECGGDVHSVAERLRELQTQHPERLVSRNRIRRSAAELQKPSDDKTTD